MYHQILSTFWFYHSGLLFYPSLLVHFPQFVDLLNTYRVLQRGVGIIRSWPSVVRPSTIYYYIHLAVFSYLLLWAGRLGCITGQGRGDGGDRTRADEEWGLGRGGGYLSQEAGNFFFLLVLEFFWCISAFVLLGHGGKQGTDGGWGDVGVLLHGRYFSDSQSHDGWLIRGQRKSGFHNHNRNHNPKRKPQPQPQTAAGHVRLDWCVAGRWRDPSGAGCGGGGGIRPMWYMYMKGGDMDWIGG
jgi:hypothetical protein